LIALIINTHHRDQYSDISHQDELFPISDY